MNKEKRKEYFRQYRLKNKDRIKEYMRKYKRNKEKNNLYMKAYHVKNKDRINERHRINMEKYRAKNPKYRIRYQLLALERKEIFANIKKEKGCMTCRENDPRCLDFHHKDPKTKKFTIGNSKLRNLLETMEEIKKCIIYVQIVTGN